MRNLLKGLSTGLGCLLLVGSLQASKNSVFHERVQLVKEIETRLNTSFQCEFSVSIGKTRKYATTNSSGIIIIDRSFLQTADRDRIFFALAHEYAHAYLEHDVLLFQHLKKSRTQDGYRLAEVRRRLEKEADGIAARKAKQMGFSVDSVIQFILANPDPEKGLALSHRAYSKPRDRADYILAVYRSS
ncbi:MAG: hypothetical protein AB1898_18400 [Acidobacteriota bacterium]